jgi:transcriptional regulator with XRE-family HTH domain
MTVIHQWTGRHAHALRAAMRQTNEAFAEHLGVSARTVAKWRERPEMVPSPQLQEALDTSLNLATPDARARFAANLGPANLGATNLSAANRGAEDHPPTLDDSVLGQLYAAVGDLARVLTRMSTEPRLQPGQARRTAG